MAEAVATTAVGADVAARDTAVPARADPAVLSVRRAGMMMVRFMDMISPWFLTEVSGLPQRFAGPARRISVHVLLASVLGCFMH